MNLLKMRTRYKNTKLFSSLLIYILISAVNLSATAQNLITDSSVSCFALWKKGEERKLKITQTKSSGSSESDMKSTTSMSYIALVSVLDATEEGYKIKWKFEQPELQNAGRITDVSGVPIFDGMEFIFSTFEGGMFQELENWEAVRDNYKNLMLLSIKDTANDGFKLAMEKTMGLFSTREQVENSLINEIQLYHALYGLEFSRTPVKGQTILPNPYGTEGFPAITELNVALSPFSTEFMTIGMNVELDRKSSAKVLKELLKKLDLPENDPGFAKTIEEIEISERSEYQVIISDGWIKQAMMTKVSKIGSVRQASSYLIELLDD